MSAVALSAARPRRGVAGRAVVPTESPARIVAGPCVVATPSPPEGASTRTGREPTGRERALVPTPPSERRLIAAAQRGDAVAQAQLLAKYEPLVRRIAGRLYLPGGDRHDVAQEARIGLASAIRDWDPARGVPFSAFATLCAVREAQMAVAAARARKHRPLTEARRLHRSAGDESTPDPLSLEDAVAVSDRPDEDPLTKTLSRERLRIIRSRARTLSQLERNALAMSANDVTHREAAAALGVGVRAINNALQRARAKLLV
jgi:RNA polymerase sporulation-specific sigma factor